MTEFGPLPLRRPLPRFDFHVAAAARRRYGLGTELVSLQGSLLVADPRRAQELAEKVNRVRDAARYPEEALRTGDLYAAGLIDEILHLLVAVYRERADPGLPGRLLDDLQRAPGHERLAAGLRAFVAGYPPAAVLRGEETPESYLQGQEAGLPRRYIALEEMLLLWLGNENPANSRLGDLIYDGALRESTAYLRFIDGFRSVLDAGPAFGPDGESLFDLLLAPARHSPTSLEGQLLYMRERWAPLLGERFGALLQRLLTTLDVLAEERKGGAPGGPGPAQVLDAAALRGDAFYRAAAPAEYERFSPDASWMPRVVLLAKSSFVWLDQLSRRYGRPISRLDEVPDEELAELAGRGITGLWLIGLWERSEASRRIKHLRGQPEAVASAYSLYDYVIAADLGGEAAYQNLRDRAWASGIRLASDMVPNHVGIDGRWVLEHPDWFIGLDHSPYPGYGFSGPDLSSDPHTGIYLEDHYYDGTDAAVVFKRVDRGTGAERYLYHGNDGTALPWNDTAQLNYLLPEVREAVIETILHVARKFPIIRFDAAMVLAKEHIERLWFPEPGHGGAIPSRAHYGSMSKDEFDRRIPREFWREVVDRVAAEVPDTLLLAEAFWMMEGYFVRTLGMHRVYNSAFMNMLKNEDNAQYRQFVKNVLAFDPEILRRFVNFMNNPDEETALAQFGRGDKYFGVCTLLATMPGLPMFGHGQVEGYSEKYGMEYRRAKLHEEPDAELLARHRREIFPLLHRRAQFAETENFLFYDVTGAGGQVQEDVFAYSNRVDGRASLVVYHNCYAEAAGWIRNAAPYAEPGRADPGRSLHRSLQDGLALRAGAGDFLVFRDHASGLEYLRRSRDLAEQGFFVSLGAFKYHVFLDFREVAESDEAPYGRLERELAGRGVPSVAGALEDLKLRPLHEALARVLQSAEIPQASSGPAPADGAISESYRAFLAEARRHGGEEPRRERVAAFEEAVRALRDLPDRTRPDARVKGGESGSTVEDETRGPAEEATTGPLADLAPTPADRLLLLAWAALHDLVPQEQVPQDHQPPGLAAGLYRRWRLAGPVRAALAQLDPDAAQRERLLPLLLRHGGWLPAHERLLAGLRTDQDALEFLGVHSFEGERWFNREAYRELTRALVLLESFRARFEKGLDAERVREALQELRAAELRSGYRLEALRAARAPAAGGKPDREQP